MSKHCKPAIMPAYFYACYFLEWWYNKIENLCTEGAKYENRYLFRFPWSR
jgi:hypothetical protein